MAAIPARYALERDALAEAAALTPQQKARAYYAKLLQIAKAADQPGRPELAEARKAAR